MTKQRSPSDQSPDEGASTPHNQAGNTAVHSNSRAAWCLSAASAILLYCSAPPINQGWLAFIAISPLIGLAWMLVASKPFKWKRAVFATAFLYWFASLQGLRHAHPLMIGPLLALAAYLAVYPVLFVAFLRQWLEHCRQDTPVTKWGSGAGLAVSAAVIWVGLEWIRNVFATGISVLMLGHSLVNYPLLIQIADLSGTYTVSFLLMLVNVAMFAITGWLAHQKGVGHRFGNLGDSGAISSSALAMIALVATVFYGSHRMSYETQASGTTVLLLGRDEQTEYQQDEAREVEIFSRYAQLGVDAAAKCETPVTAVVWPESMFAGGRPLYEIAPGMVVPAGMAASMGRERLSASEFGQLILDGQKAFEQRARGLQQAMRNDDGTVPAIIGGCGLVRYGETPAQFSGVVHVSGEGRIAGTYAKNHLVMFGETIPLLRSIPGIRNLVPPGLGLQAGSGPEVFSMPGLRVLPNLCIETAVERVAVNHLRQLRMPPAVPSLPKNGLAPGEVPDAIVTLTNDAWFDRTAVVDHHLRCAQMVAVGCRRPVLSSANGGPTAWIDSFGRVVEKLPYDQAGAIEARPMIDDRTSFYTMGGAWFAAGMGGLMIAVIGFNMLSRRRLFSVRAFRSRNTSH